MTPQSGISWAGVVWRMLFAVALVLLTFNPTGHSFYHWLTAPPTGISASKAFVGILLLIGWLFCVRTAVVSLGRFGMILVAALLAAGVWLLVDLGLIALTGSSAFTWVALVLVGVLLGLGLSWSLIRERTTGQFEVH
jgi:hypothetical protein